MAASDGTGGGDTQAIVVTVTDAVAPAVTAVAVNGGAAQRSRVTEITVTFDSVVALAAGAFTLTRQSDGVALTDGRAAPQVVVNAAVVGGQTAVTLAFTAATGSSAVEGGSLADGVWILLIDRTKVTVSGERMAADYTTPSSGPGRIHRLYGDTDGDGYVGNADGAQFRQRFGQSV